MTTTAILQELAGLPVADRAYLAEKLLATLDSSEVLSEIEHIWCDTALQRYESLQSGQSSSRPAELVMRDLRATLE